MNTETMTPLERIEQQAQTADEARAVLRAAADELKARVDAIRAEALDGLRAATRNFREATANLAELVKAHPDAFVKPKSRAAHGWKFGWRKKPGKIEVKDEPSTIALIRKHLPDQAELLIARKECVVKAALDQLSGANLKRIGVVVTEDTDQPFCTPIGDDIDQMVDTLLGDELAEALRA